MEVTRIIQLATNKVKNIDYLSILYDVMDTIMFVQDKLDDLLDDFCLNDNYHDHDTENTVNIEHSVIDSQILSTNNVDDNTTDNSTNNDSSTDDEWIDLG